MMRSDQLDQFRSVGRPHLHPDGHRVVFDVVQMDFDDNRYNRQIWLWDGSARPLTFGGGDMAPRWSPDGSMVAFLRRSGGSPAQVAVMSTDGGEARVVTDLPLGVIEFAWSPDGSSLAVVGVEWIPELAEFSDEERTAEPRRIDAAVYRFDTQGWRHDRMRRIWIVPVDGEARRLTDLDIDESAPSWSADGSRVYFLQEFVEPTHTVPGSAIVGAAVDGSDTTVVHPRGQWMRVAAGPDGAVFGVGLPDPAGWPGLVSLWDLSGDDPVDLTGHIDRSVWSFLMPPATAQPVWLGDEFAIGLVDSGRIHVVTVNPSGHTVLVGGDRYVNGFSLTPDGSRIVFTAHDTTNPGDLYEIVDGKERRLTDLNAEFVGAVDFVAPDHFRVPVDDVEIDAWVFTPPGDGPFPVLVNIHGGPASQYGFGFFDEFQVYATAGYAVVACNPRGSEGRGRDFVRAVTGDGWGTVDERDVTAVLDAALARDGRLDAASVGIMGGSYGGFLTAWMTGRSDRFRSSVVERALLNWSSFSGTSDIGPWFSSMYLGAELPDGAERLAAGSPQTFAHRVQTPTLIVHSENDFRCPIEQAEQFFITLLRAGTTTEFLRYPGESHELSRSGTPRHRRHRFDAILEWHDRHLQGN